MAPFQIAPPVKGLENEIERKIQKQLGVSMNRPKPTKRKSIPMNTKVAVLHESGYLCANPACRMVMTLDMHHMEYVSEGGTNEATNLLPLCPTCHALHHQGLIPAGSIRTWKMLLITLNEGFDRKSVSTLLMLEKLESVRLSGDGRIECAALIASGLVMVLNRTECEPGLYGMPEVVGYLIQLSPKGPLFVDAWKRGDQDAAVKAHPSR